MNSFHVWNEGQDKLKPSSCNWSNISKLDGHVRKCFGSCKHLFDTVKRITDVHSTKMSKPTDLDFPRYNMFCTSKQGMFAWHAKWDF